MPRNDLSSYIESSRVKGVTDEQIKAGLIKSGWQENTVDSALKSAGEDLLPLPPPPAPHFDMWIGFSYLLLFVSLYVFATALGGILNYAVDDFIPDSLDKVNVAYSARNYLMQFYQASLIVSFPIFAILFLILKKQAIKTPSVKGLRVRKLLIYLTLFGTFLIMLGHIIGTVYGFLGGTITTRSIAHLAVTFIVAGSIFSYFMFDVWGDRTQS